MSIKLKRWHKITLISIAGILAVLIFFNIWLNSFLRKNIEESFNSVLNAKVNIEKLKVNFFTGSVNIYGFSITGKKDFKNDTIAYLEKLILKPLSYDSKTMSLNIRNITISELKIKSIISENGNNCWDNIIKEDSTAGKENENLKLFVENFNLENASVDIIDRQTNKNQYFSKINITINSKKESGKIISDFNSDCLSVTDYLGEKSFSVSGNLKYENNIIDAAAIVTANNFPLNINLKLNIDSISTIASELNIDADFSELPVTEDIVSKGKLKLKISSSGIFDNNPVKSFYAVFSADSLTLLNTANNKGLFADFDLTFNYDNSANRDIRISSDTISLSSGNEQLNGFLDFRINDSALIADSEITGSFGTRVLNDIFENVASLPVINFNVSSDIKGSLNAKENRLNGEFLADISFLGKQVKIPEFTATFNKDNFKLNTFICSDLLTGRFDYQLSGFENLFKPGTLKQLITTDISSIYIPETGGMASPGNITGFENKSSDFRFPVKTETVLKLSVDSVISEQKAVTNINAELRYMPGLAEISNFSLNIGEGILSGKATYRKLNDNLQLMTDFKLQNLDLSFFANDSVDIAGIICFDFKNTVYEGSDTTIYRQNKGTNSLKITGFRIKTGILHEYEIDEDYIKIEDTELYAELNADIFSIRPSDIIINDAAINLKGKYNILNNSILIPVLFDIPDKYMSSKIKLAISMFSESSKKKIPEKEKRNTYLLRIGGTIAEPEYKIFE